MTEQEVFAKVTEIIQEALDDETLKIDMESNADSLPGWDSANHINIVLAVEQMFKIKFKIAEIEELRDVGSLVALIRQKTG